MEEFYVPYVHAAQKSAPSVLTWVLAKLSSQPTILIVNQVNVKNSHMEVAKATETSMPLLETVYKDVIQQVS